MTSLGLSNSACISEGVVIAYLDARLFVERNGFEFEIASHERLDFEALCESQFLEEFAWVVLSSGMSEAVIRPLFRDFTTAFRHWRSAKEIADNSNSCRSEALRVFGNRRKVDAIISISVWLAENGIDAIKEGLKACGPSYLRQFSLMGPATSLHLAKNVGLRVAKPDRHLVRLAAATNCQSVEELCGQISLVTAHAPSVVDLVLWRYATLDQNYVATFEAAAQGSCMR